MVKLNLDIVTINKFYSEIGDGHLICIRRIHLVNVIKYIWNVRVFIRNKKWIF